MAERLGPWAFGCDDCQTICPWNRAPLARCDPELRAREGQRGLDLDALLALTLDEYRRRFWGTALARARFEGLVRNAILAAGHAGDARRLPAIEAHLAIEFPEFARRRAGRRRGSTAAGRPFDRAKERRMSHLQARLSAAQESSRWRALARVLARDGEAARPPPHLHAASEGRRPGREPPRRLPRREGQGGGGRAAVRPAEDLLLQVEPEVAGRCGRTSRASSCATRWSWRTSRPRCASCPRSGREARAGAGGRAGRERLLEPAPRRARAGRRPGTLRSRGLPRRAPLRRRHAARGRRPGGAAGHGRRAAPGRRHRRGAAAHGGRARRDGGVVRQGLLHRPGGGAARHLPRANPEGPGQARAAGGRRAGNAARAGGSGGGRRHERGRGARGPDWPGLPAPSALDGGRTHRHPRRRGGGAAGARDGEGHQ